MDFSQSPEPTFEFGTPHDAGTIRLRGDMISAEICAYYAPLVNWWWVRGSAPRTHHPTSYARASPVNFDRKFYVPQVDGDTVLPGLRRPCLASCLWTLARKLYWDSASHQPGAQTSSSTPQLSCRKPRQTTAENHHARLTRRQDVAAAGLNRFRRICRVSAGSRPSPAAAGCGQKRRPPLRRLGPVRCGKPAADGR